MKLFKKISAALLAGALMFGGSGIVKSNDSNTVSAATYCSHNSSYQVEQSSQEWKVNWNRKRMEHHVFYQKLKICRKCNICIWETHTDTIDKVINF